MLVLRRIKTHTQKLHALADSGAQWRAILSNPCGEHQRIQSAETCHHAAYFAAQTMGVYIKCQTRPIFAFSNGREYLPHVSRNARHAFQPGLAVEQAVQLVSLETL